MLSEHGVPHHNGVARARLPPDTYKDVHRGVHVLHDGAQEPATTGMTGDQLNTNHQPCRPPLRQVRGSRVAEPSDLPERFIEECRPSSNTLVDEKRVFGSVVEGATLRLPRLPRVLHSSVSLLFLYTHQKTRQILANPFCFLPRLSTFRYCPLLISKRFNFPSELEIQQHYNACSLVTPIDSNAGASVLSANPRLSTASCTWSENLLSSQ